MNWTMQWLRNSFPLMSRGQDLRKRLGNELHLLTWETSNLIVREVPNFAQHYNKTSFNWYTGEVDSDSD